MRCSTAFAGLVIGLGLALLPTKATAQTTRLDSDTFGVVAPRPIGPAVMSGRVAAMDAALTEPLTVWVGAASGGVWRSVDGGVTFEPVFDEHPQSIGAIAVDPSDPKTVWVGTGETWVRNSVSVGHGLYRTRDGGDTWELMGLQSTERIARILIDPTDSNRVFVAATGHLWNANPERGVYRTSDGGETWQQVLAVDADTGCADLAMDPQEPEILYAAMWQLRREPDFFTSGGPGSGLYRTLDGGDSWQELHEGLPEGDLGRIGIAVAPSRPSRVYAVVEAAAPDSGLYRSDDLGAHWMKVNDSDNVVGRPFYFATLTVDPVDHDRVYKPGTVLTVSTDGGETFSTAMMGFFGGGVHPDYHAMWIDPRDPYTVMVGTDGGVYISRDRGSKFRFVGALPISQYYHVATDTEVPYNVYGGLQDNGSWVGPSRAPGGIQSFHWSNLGGGDGFWVWPDPADSNIVYLEYQGGNISRVLRSTKESKDIKPLPAADEPDYRFNWNAPIQVGRHQRGTIYIGSQFLHRSRDRGESWERISDDLTTNDPDKQRQASSGGLTIDNTTAENHCTIYSISESPITESVLWVGTDDGNLQVTSDGGESWTNVAGNVAGVPPHTWVSWVEASPHDAETAFVTFDGHRTGDMTPYVLVTRDLGATWTPLTGEPIRGYCHVIRQDPIDPELLFVGTEEGLFTSIDGGTSWVAIKGGFPNVAVRDLAIHPREHDLVLATHGRGLWILDDLTPIRTLSEEILDTDVALLDARPSVLTIPAYEQRFDGHGVFSGDSPSDTATITYYLKKRHIFGDMRLEIRDDSGQLVTTLPGGKRRGINRVDWRMRATPPPSPRAESLVPNPYAFFGPRVLEGTYTVTLVKGKTEHTGTIELVPDPRSPHTAEDRQAQHAAVWKLYGMLERLAYVGDATFDAIEQLDERRRVAERSSVREQIDDLADRFTAFRTTLIASGGMIEGGEELRERISGLYGSVNGYEGRPTQSQLDRIEVLDGELEGAEQRFDELGGELQQLNERLSKRGIDPVTVIEPSVWEEQQTKVGG